VLLLIDAIGSRPAGNLSGFKWPRARRARLLGLIDRTSAADTAPIVLNWPKLVSR
jgi:hypothetical protein